MKRLQLRVHLIIWPLLLVALIVIIYLALGERQGCVPSRFCACDQPFSGEW